MRPEKARAGTGPSSRPGGTTRLAADGRVFGEGAAFPESREERVGAADDAGRLAVVERGAALGSASG
ncbi:hypothetical protein [Sinomonas sp.]|uniref:hypothetical protein n=1 Tax=Sinomonas sp. TaxID=1914986 RepID=UPI003F808601